MKKDFKARLKDIVESDRARRKANSERYSKLVDDWQTLSTGVVGPVLKEAEHELFDLRPAVDAFKDGEAAVFELRYDTDDTDQLRYELSFADGKVEVSTVVRGERQRELVDPERLTAEVVQQQVEVFVERSLKKASPPPSRQR